MNGCIAGFAPAALLPAGVPRGPWWQLEPGSACWAASFPDCSGTGSLRWDMMGHFPWETPGSQKLGSALEMPQYVKVNKLM